MFEKWCEISSGKGLNCLFERAESSQATRNPITVTIRAPSFRLKGMVIVGVFRGVMLLVISRPAKMLPQARRLMEFKTA